MRYTPVLNILGILLAILAITMIVPMVADIATGSSNWQAFAISALATGFVGIGLFLAHNNQADFDIGLRQAFANQQRVVINWTFWRPTISAI